MNMKQSELNKPCQECCKDCIFTNVCFAKEGKE